METYANGSDLSDFPSLFPEGAASFLGAAFLLGFTYWHKLSAVSNTCCQWLYFPIGVDFAAISKQRSRISSLVIDMVFSVIYWGASLDTTYYDVQRSLCVRDASRR